MPSAYQMERKAPGRMSVDFVKSTPKGESVYTIREWVDDLVVDTMNGKEEIEALLFEEVKKHLEIKVMRRQQLLGLFGDEEVVGKKVKVVLNDRDWICLEAADD